MALREIEFTVDEGGVLSPADIQIGGVQGEHRATELVFEFSDELYERLKGESKNGTLVYRFDIVDGECKEHHSDTALLCGPEVRLPLEYAITQHGGLIKVVLIVSFMRESADEPETFVVKSEEAQIKLAFSPYVNEKQEYEDISILVQTVKAKAEEATQALLEIQTARNAIEDLLGELDNPNEFVFQGGNASGAIDADFIIDDEMSDVSCNAVQNKVAMRYVDEAVANATAGFSELHPVGSVFITNENLTPEELGERFGGMWEKQKVLKSVGGRVNIVFEGDKTKVDKQVLDSDFKILLKSDEEGKVSKDNNFHITVTPLSGVPESCFVCAGDVLNKKVESGEETIEYFASFNVKAYRANKTGFPVYWHITGESYTDNNGNYHWIRTA